MCDNHYNYEDNLDSCLARYVENSDSVTTQSCSELAPTLWEILTQIANISVNEESQRPIEDLSQLIYDYYISGARHSYAEIFIFLRDLRENSSDIIESLDLIDINTERVGEFISNNINNFHPSSHIRVPRENQNNFNLELRYFKLRDHISLETARIRFWQNNYKDFQDRIDRLALEVDYSTDKAEKVRNLTDTALDEVKSFRTTQVTILTAFIAILLIVVADIKFSASLVIAASKIPLYQICLLIAFGAFVTLNVSFLLLKLVANIVDKDKALDNCKIKWVNYFLIAIMGGIIINSIYKIIML